MRLYQLQSISTTYISNSQFIWTTGSPNFGWNGSRNGSRLTPNSFKHLSHPTSTYDYSLSI